MGSGTPSWNGRFLGGSSYVKLNIRKTLGKDYPKNALTVSTSIMIARSTAAVQLVEEYLDEEGHEPHKGKALVGDYLG